MPNFGSGRCQILAGREFSLYKQLLSMHKVTVRYGKEADRMDPMMQPKPVASSWTCSWSNSSAQSHPMAVNTLLPLVAHISQTFIWREKDEPYDDERRNRTRNSDRRTRSKNRSRWRRNRPAITVSRPRLPLRNHFLPLGAREMRACAERKRDSATKRREKLQKK